MGKKGFKKCFTNNSGLIFQQSSSATAPSPSYEAEKRHLISELQRIFLIRNEYKIIREASNRSDEDDFLDDREREAFETFHVLIDNAGIELLDDPDVLKAIEVTDLEFDVQTATLEAEDFMMGLKVGQEVRIVRGGDIGKKGKVLAVTNREKRVALRFLNGQEVAVGMGDVANLGSMEEDNCLMELMK